MTVVNQIKAVFFFSKGSESIFHVGILFCVGLLCRSYL